MVIKLSAPFSEKLGAREISMELKDKASLRSVLELLVERYPVLEETINPGRIDESYGYALLCVNEGRIMKLDERVNDGDTIRIIPPIIGG